MIEIARAFGTSLDQDDFEKTKSLLSPECEYVIGNETLHGPEAIRKSYEDNMIAGLKKIDKLEWGETQIESHGDNQFYVHFTDYLEHKGKAYTHRCKQLLSLNESEIQKIEHINEPDEHARLQAFYKEVGLA